MYSETLESGLERTAYNVYGGYGDEGGSEEDEPEPAGYGGPQPTTSVAAPMAATTSAAPAKPAFDSYRFFWNQRWQSCLERTCLTREDARQRVEELKDLLDRFVQTAIPVCEVRDIV